MHGQLLLALVSFRALHVLIGHRSNSLPQLLQQGVLGDQVNIGASVHYFVM